MVETTRCPECGSLAEVTDRAVLESTDGPVEHARVTCLRRHWFLLPVAALAADGAPAPPAPGAPTSPAAGRHAVEESPPFVVARPASSRATGTRNGEQET